MEETQFVDTLANNFSQQMAAPVEGISVLDLALKGGWVMVILALLSVVAVYVFIRKLIEIRQAIKDEKSFMARIQDYMQDDKISSALKLCDETDSPYARMIKKGITHRNLPLSDVRVTIENVGNVEVGRLEKSLPVLATIAAGAPMIGFLGTVTGMVRAFFDMANLQGAALDVSVLSGGIYEALVTTVGGLIVGIATLFAYNYLVALLDKVINRMEAKTLEFMDVLNEYQR